MNVSRVILVLMATVLSSCSKEDGFEVKAENAYALRGLDNSWPSIHEPSAHKSGHLLNKNYYIVFDNSKSMLESKCLNDGRTKAETAKIALMDFVNRMPEKTQIGLAGFDQRGLDEYIPLASAYETEFNNTVSNFIPGGNIALDKAIKLGYRALETQANMQQGYGEYHLIIVTDGEQKKGDSTKAIKRAINDSAIMLHAFAICSNAQNALKQDGISYRSIYTRRQLEEALSHIIGEVDVEPSVIELSRLSR